LIIYYIDKKGNTSMNFNLQISNSAMGNNVRFRQGACKDDYNLALPAFTKEIAAVREQLDLSLGKLDGDTTHEPFFLWEDVIEALSNSSHILERIAHGLEERPPALPPGTVIPADMYGQRPRPPWGWRMYKQPVEKLNVVVAHYIPLSKRSDISFNQIVPTDYLKELGRPLRGKNGSLLYCSRSYGKNSRATAQLEDGTASIYGNAFWVPSPLETERWFARTFEPQSMSEATSSLHRIGVTRFTVDTLRDGRLLLSFATQKDQLNAIMALS
jgi:hypothetical protein